MSYKVPVGWEVRRFEDIFEFKNGVNASKEQYGRGVRFINVMEVIKHSSLMASDIPGMVEVSESDKQLYSVKKGDVLFNRTSETPEEIGMTSVYLDDEDVVFGGFVIRGRPKAKLLDYNFCKYCFSTPEIRKEFIKRGQGVIRANIGQGDLNDIHLLIPTLKEQKKISELLSAWDKAIDFIEKIQLRIETTRAAYSRAIFRNNDKTKNVTIMKLDDLFTQRTERGGDDLELLSVTRTRGIISQSQSDKKDTSNSDKSKYLRVYKNDLVYNTMRMWQGVSAVSSKEGLVSPAYTVCYLTDSSNDINYFGYLFKERKTIHEFHRRSQGLVDDTLNLKYENFRKIQLPIHQPQDQKKIALFFKSIEKKAAQLERLSILYKSQREELLKNLLTGIKRI